MGSKLKSIPLATVYEVIHRVRPRELPHGASWVQGAMPHQFGMGVIDIRIREVITLERTKELRRAKKARKKAIVSGIG